MKGCGKTYTSVATAGRLYLDGLINRVLIVAPSAVVPVWPKEFAEFAEFANACIALEGTRAKRLKLLDALMNTKGALQVAVINYESAWRLESELLDYNADLIICDESQRIKTHTAKQSKCLHKLARTTKYRLILTGTPVQNAPLDFFSQYKFLDSRIFGTNFYAFRSRYAQMGGYGGHQVLGYRNLDDLITKAHSIAYRVTKEDALDLPETTDLMRYVELEPKARKTYLEIKKESFTELSRGDVSVTNVLTKLLRLSQITGGFINTDDGKGVSVSKAKLKELNNIIEDVVVDGNQKVVIFVKFTAEISAIREMIEEKGIKYSWIAGEVKERGAAVEQFQTDDETKIFIAQIRTAGLGITLHAANVAVFYSLDYNFADYTQAKARIHRIGQKNACTYIHLIARDTVDEKIMLALEKKGDIAKLVVDEWRRFFE